LKIFCRFSYKIDWCIFCYYL